MLITSLAGTTSIGKFGSACLASSARTALGCPTSRMRTPYSRAASTLPSTAGRGAWSPPMASTAIVIMGGFDQAIPEKLPVERLSLTSIRNVSLGRHVLNRFALVVATMGAHLVPQHIGQKETFPFKKTNLRVILFKPRFFRLLTLGQRAVKEIERAVHLV